MQREVNKHKIRWRCANWSNQSSHPGQTPEDPAQKSQASLGQLLIREVVSTKQRPFFLVYKGRNKRTRQSLQVASVLAGRSLLARDAQGLELVEEVLSVYEFKSKNSFLLSRIPWLSWPGL